MPLQTIIPKSENPLAMCQKLQRMKKFFKIVPDSTHHFISHPGRLSRERKRTSTARAMCDAFPSQCTAHFAWSGSLTSYSTGELGSTEVVQNEPSNERGRVDAKNQAALCCGQKMEQSVAA